jgi:hypothetical protein
MTHFKVEIVADSINESGNRITTMVVTYPRIIHSEIMTHRMFSRNAASSRAVPSRKLIESVKNEPFIPIAFQKSHSGMQGVDYIIDQKDIDFEIADWLDDRDYAIKKAEGRLTRGLTKQLINRPLEPFQWYTTIITATEWENFFHLRCPRYQMDGEMSIARSKKEAIAMWADGDSALEDHLKNYSELEWLQINKGQAEIHMMKIAEMMWDAYIESTPEKLAPGQWHIPYSDKLNDLHGLGLSESKKQGRDISDFSVDEIALFAVKLSTVMSARTSYTVVGEDLKPITHERMIELHDGMKRADPLHMSPFEHCAQNPTEEYVTEYGSDFWSGNFKGWIQYRKMIHGENKEK